MKEALDRLAKDLAGGMSRRDALKRFGSGLAVAMGALFSARASEADGNNRCRDWCREFHPSDTYLVCDDYFLQARDENGNPIIGDGTGGQGQAFGECMAQSTGCPPGECAMECYGTWICVSAY